jgi:hypothetical protein
MSNHFVTKERARLGGPACNKCGGTSTLLSAEPHPRFKHTDLRTFKCTVCEEQQTVMAPLPHG